MTLLVDLERIAAAAQQQADDYDAFAYYIELYEASDGELDALVERLAAPIIAGIDCITCANCCRSLDVYLTAEDAQRLADGLHIPLAALQERYLDHEQAAAQEEWAMFRHRPCVFLKEKRCQVYAHRPESCRAYPAFTPDFRWQIRPILSGVGLCPIIYNLIEALKHQLGW